MLTVALHFETGYLAFVPLVVWPFLIPSDLWRRLLRAVAIGAAALLASAWVIVPAAGTSPTGRRATRSSAARARRTGTAPPRCCAWLITGQLYDVGARPGRHGPRRRGPRRLHRTVAHLRRRPRPRHHLGGHTAHDVRPDDLRLRSTTLCRGAATSSSVASRWACSSPASCWPAVGIVVHRAPRRSARSTPASRRTSRGWTEQPDEPRHRGGPVHRGAADRSRPAWCEHRTPTTATTGPTSRYQAESDAAQVPQIDQLSTTCGPTPGAASTPDRRPTGARTSPSAPSRCSSTSRARTSTRSATRCARRRS